LPADRMIPAIMKMPQKVLFPIKLAKPGSAQKS
jgi:hypothetical protein